MIDLDYNMMNNGEATAESVRDKLRAIASGSEVVTSDFAAYNVQISEYLPAQPVFRKKKENKQSKKCKLIDMLDDNELI